MSTPNPRAPRARHAAAVPAARALVARLALPFAALLAVAGASVSAAPATAQAPVAAPEPEKSLFAPLEEQWARWESRLPAPDAPTLTPDDIQVLMSLGRVDLAASRLDRLAGDPRETAVARARVHMARNDFAAARPLIGAMLAAPAPTDAEREVGYLWLFTADDSPEIDRRTRGLSLAPGSIAPIPEFLAAGRLAYSLLNFDRADSCYSRALDRADALPAGTPKEAEIAAGWRSAALRGLGLVQYRRRDYDGALAKQEAALAARATTDALMGLAETLIRLGRTDEAIAAAEWTVRMNPYHESGHYYLGNGYARKNYTELAAAYPNNFVDPAGRLALARADSLLAQGARAAARSAYEAVHAAHPAWADALVRLASLDFEEGRAREGRDRCFAALAACPEYGRAHATLAKLLEFQRFEIDVHRADYEARFAAQPMPVLPGIETYVANWKSLSPRHQKRVALSLAPWATFLPVLIEGGSTHYIKPLYQLLSETPGLETLRDQRISYDSRLWDDVRGAGGYNTVTGIEDVERTIFDRYNTVLHESTHQVHGVLTADQSRVIQEHYRKAKERDDVTQKGYLSRYAGGSVWEYFAEGANALCSRKRDQYDTREEVYERLVTIDPDLMTLVQHFFDLRDVEPNYAIAYVNAGQDRLYKGYVEPAIEFYEKALRRTPDEETALTSLLFAQTIQADRPAVTKNAARALELYPGSGPVRNTAMDARWRTGQPLEALVTELAAARPTVKPEDRYQVDMAIGNAWWNLGQADKAMAAYDSVLAYQSDSPEGLWGMGAALALAGRWDESFEYYGKAVRLRTGVVSLRCDFARDLIRAGRIADAQDHLDEAKILEAENAPAEALRGWAALARGDADAALAHARQAREWGPWCDLARIIEARALKARGDLSGADQAVAPIRERLAAGTPPGYIYLPKQATWQSIHELPAVERALIADITRP